MYEIETLKNNKTLLDNPKICKLILHYQKKYIILQNIFKADVAELVDAPDLGSGAARRGGSSPFIRIFLKFELLIF